MHRIIRMFSALLVCGLLGAAQPSVVAADAQPQPAPPPSGDTSQEHKNQTVVGTIESVEEDADGNVTQVALWDDDESYYRIDPAGKGRDLLQLVASRVKATGTVREDDNGDLVLTVTSYVVLEHAKKDPPDDDGGRDEDGDGT